MTYSVLILKKYYRSGIINYNIHQQCKKYIITSHNNRRRVDCTVTRGRRVHYNVFSGICFLIFGSRMPNFLPYFKPIPICKLNLMKGTLMLAWADIDFMQNHATLIDGV